MKLNLRPLEAKDLLDIMLIINAVAMVVMGMVAVYILEVPAPEICLPPPDAVEDTCLRLLEGLKSMAAGWLWYAGAIFGLCLWARLIIWHQERRAKSVKDDPQ